MILRYSVAAATLTVVLASLAVAQASAAPVRPVDCSGVLQCATVTLPPASKSPGMGQDHQWNRQGFKPSDRGDQFPRGTWYKPYGPFNTTPRR